MLETGEEAQARRIEAINEENMREMEALKSTFSHEKKEFENQLNSLSVQNRELDEEVRNLRF